MTFSAALTRLAFVVCLVVLLLALLPFVPPPVFVFALALFTIGLPMVYVIPSPASKGYWQILDFGFAAFIVWMIVPWLYQTMLKHAETPATITMLFLLAALVYALILVALKWSLKRSDWLRRFSTLRETHNGG
ncbi:hypothetical protein Q31b_58190 [Novipirellula aureliae]|uniref:Uncharacterized protein n=1 Tax=Novipirellula aureliae TaxID=2527966 RepID=A0A5C6DC37_9BACT|nr:hypothetical protein [Novipirellula aureliae]TWU32776.1 hypothetical protein Q31b_58190 [Novipirellula aureliae]